MESMAKLITFKAPKLAIIVVILTVFTLAMALVPYAGVEKAGYMLAMGVGLMLLSQAGKAMSSEFANLAVLMVLCSVACLTAAIFATPAWVFAASAIEGEISAIIGGFAGLFVKVEEG